MSQSQSHPYYVIADYEPFARLIDALRVDHNETVHTLTIVAGEHLCSKVTVENRQLHSLTW
jgi:hypothetical protein